MPHVPSEVKTWVTCPPVCRQISGPGGADVGLDVLLVGVLVGHHVAIAPSALACVFARPMVPSSLPGSGQSASGHHLDLGSEDLEEDLLLLGHLGWHHRQHRVAAHAGDGGQAEAGVPAGGLDDAPAGSRRSELAASLEVPDHRPGGPVLDRSEGVHPLELGPELRALRHQPVQADERRRVLLVGEQLRDVFVNACRVIHRAAPLTARVLGDVTAGARAGRELPRARQPLNDSNSNAAGSGW